MHSVVDKNTNRIVPSLIYIIIAMSSSKERVFVTAATGNIGSGIVRGLVKKGIDTTAYVRDQQKAENLFKDELSTGHLKFVVGAYDTIDVFSKAIQGHTRLFLLVADRGNKPASMSQVKARGKRLTPNPCLAFCGHRSHRTECEALDCDQDCRDILPSTAQSTGVRSESRSTVKVSEYGRSLEVHYGVPDSDHSVEIILWKLKLKLKHEGSCSTDYASCRRRCIFY